MKHFFECDPPSMTAQSQRRLYVRNGKPVVAYTKAAEVVFGKIAKLLLAKAPKRPFTKTVKVTVHWCFPKRKKDLKYERERIPSGVRPDLDNILKGFLDLVQKTGYIKNDSQIAELCAGKYFADKPGIYLEITNLEN